MAQGNIKVGDIFRLEGAEMGEVQWMGLTVATLKISGSGLGTQDWLIEDLLKRTKTYSVDIDVEQWVRTDQGVGRVIGLMRHNNYPYTVKHLGNDHTELYVAEELELVDYRPVKSDETRTALLSVNKEIEDLEARLAWLKVAQRVLMEKGA